MKTYTVAELNEILRKHELWLKNDPSGARANLRSADLRSADLRSANLYGADLCGANLYGANLRSADLRSADLRSADLCGANLYGANLRSADLRSANLYGADLCGANLRSADLCGANLYGANLRSADLRSADLRSADLRSADLRSADLCGANLYGANLRSADLYEAKDVKYPIACPEKGSFIGFKKVRGNYIVELEVPADALRSSATSRKCRCSHAKVISITTLDGSPTGVDVVYSNHDSSFAYSVDSIVRVDDFDTNRWNECAPGIHFFITRQEAVEYNMF